MARAWHRCSALVSSERGSLRCVCFGGPSGACLGVHILCVTVSLSLSLLRGTQTDGPSLLRAGFSGRVAGFFSRFPISGAGRNGKPDAGARRAGQSATARLQADPLAAPRQGSAALQADPGHTVFPRGRRVCVCGRARGGRQEDRATGRLPNAARRAPKGSADLGQRDGSVHGGTCSHAVGRGGSRL